jgi:AcrR family transcriptional regulator
MEPRKRPSPATTRRLDRSPRAAGAIDKILAGAVRTIIERGAGKMSMLDVGAAAGVSRGTLYRYFPTKEKLLEAVTQHLLSQYDDRIAAATATHVEAGARLGALFEFLGAHLEGGLPHRFLEVEPHFALGFYRRNFPRFLARTETTLAPVFDEWERMTGKTVDRTLLAELAVRYTLSDLLVPTGASFGHLRDRLMALLEAKDR